MPRYTCDRSRLHELFVNGGCNVCGRSNIDITGFPICAKYRCSFQKFRYAAVTIPSLDREHGFSPVEEENIAVAGGESREDGCDGGTSAA